MQVENEQSLFDKLRGIMQDPELATEIGGPIEIITFPGLVASGRLTQEQTRELSNLRSEAIDSLLTPEQKAEANLDASHRANEVSEYIHTG